MGSKIPGNLVIQEFRAVHGDRYDYSKFVYKNSSTKSVIICREHGEFLQPSTTHRKGVGCPKCALEASYKRQRALAEEFAKVFETRSREAHGNFYDYSKVVYETARKKVCIVCPIHGEFWQEPYNHIEGHGCAKCRADDNSVRNTNTKERFAATANERHDNRYEYNKVVYRSASENVIITCPKHGDFPMAPNVHLNGVGCPKCKKEEGAIRVKLVGFNKLLEENKSLHGEMYLYDKTNYSAYNVEVTITCKLHGDFLITPEKHSKGYGCPACGKGVQMHKGDLEYFINKARTVHGDKYDYSKSVYINNATKLIIICPIHGEFLQSPNKHLNGCGCRLCGNIKISETPREAPVKGKLMRRILKKYGDKYDYSKVKDTYINPKQSVTIICGEHGEFQESLTQHLKGSGGCQKCRLEQYLTIGKKCIKCGELKNLDEYHLNKKSIDKRVSICKVCVLSSLQQSAKFSQYGRKLVPDDKPTNVDGWLYVRCKKCGKMFQPTVSACRQRRAAVNGIRGDSNFYCSDSCKDTCDIYSAIKYPSSIRPDRPGGEFRDCSRVIKRSLLESQCDSDGHNYCEICGDTIAVDLHHTVQVKDKSSDTNNAAGMVLLCPGCHTKTHAVCK